MANLTTVTAPAAWASAIVNLDYSGLDPEDVADLNTFLAEEGLSFRDCVDCTEEGFSWHHDARRITGTGATVARYTFR